jgi:streptogramin lyase
MSVDRRLTEAAQELRALQGELDPARRLGQLQRRARRQRQGVRTAALATAALLLVAAAWLGVVRGHRVGTVGTPTGPSQPQQRPVPVQGSLGRVAASIRVCASPAAVEAGPGSLWVACLSDDTVVRVDPHTGRVRATIDVGGQPGGLGVGAGAVWVALTDRAALLRIDPATNRVVASLPGPAYGTAVDFGNFHEHAQVPHRIGVTRDALWVPDVAAGAVVRVDPRTGARVAMVRLGAPAVPGPGHLPLAVSVQGGIWVGDVRTALACRIDPASNRVVARRPMAVPDGLTALGDDASWAQDGPDGGWVLRRVDPRSGRTLGTLPLGRRAGGVTQAAGATWLTVTEQDLLLRIDP